MPMQEDLLDLGTASEFLVGAASNISGNDQAVQGQQHPGLPNFHLNAVVWWQNPKAHLAVQQILACFAALDVSGFLLKNISLMSAAYPFVK